MFFSSLQCFHLFPTSCSRPRRTRWWRSPWGSSTGAWTGPCRPRVRRTKGFESEKWNAPDCCCARGGTGARCGRRCRPRSSCSSRSSADKKQTKRDCKISIQFFIQYFFVCPIWLPIIIFFYEIAFCLHSIYLESCVGIKTHDLSVTNPLPWPPDHGSYPFLIVRICF